MTHWIKGELVGILLYSKCRGIAIGQKPRLMPLDSEGRLSMAWCQNERSQLPAKDVCIAVCSLLWPPLRADQLAPGPL